ncbi:MAG: hypothetical protein KatS3mg102_2479 [Planctomycetota bacterium]|nr:MAG: hypothetical protein KatS3mg102_2479 [Planctomycetota bacterium]
MRAGLGEGRERLQALLQARAPVSWAVVVLLATVHLLLAWALQEASGGGYRWYEPLPAPVLHALGAVQREALEPPERWRLLASALLHHDLVHLGLNLLALRVLGRLAEALFGAGGLGTLLLLGAVGAGLAAALEGGLGVGASGAALALLGALLAGCARRSALRRLAVRMGVLLVAVLCGGLVYNHLLAETVGLEVGNAAHGGGALVGALLGLLLPLRVGERAGGVRRALAALLLLLALGTAAVLGVEGARALAARLGGGDAGGTGAPAGGAPRSPLEELAMRALAGGAAVERWLEPVGVRLAVPAGWQELERGAHAVVLGPAGAPLRLQIVRVPLEGLGYPYAVPEVLLEHLQREHPDLVAAPLVRGRVAGRPAVRLETAYSDRGLAMQEIHHLLRLEQAVLHLRLWGRRPLPGLLEQQLLAALRVER